MRRTAQLVLLDPANRVLLFRREDDDGTGFWGPVGGGIEPGESAEHAAVREAREETGLEVALGPEIWHRRHIFTWRGDRHNVHERWFLARAPSADVRTDNWSPNEIRTITAHRWWPLDELRRCRERTVPGDLADRVADILSDGPPDEPVTIGI